MPKKPPPSKRILELAKAISSRVKPLVKPNDQPRSVEDEEAFILNTAAYLMRLSPIELNVVFRKLTT